MFKIIDEFIPQKTSDIFKSVEFVYDTYTWKGVIPKKIEHQGFEESDEVINERLPYFYEQLNPTNWPSWITIANNEWSDSQKSGETYKVLRALFSGEWECRVCGPVPKINAQPAARLRDLKKKNYIIGSQNRRCEKCHKSQMHDILVMLPKITNRVINERNYLAM